MYVCIYMNIYLWCSEKGLLVIQSSCKCEYILICLQEYHKKMAKIGSKPIKRKGWHFSFLIKVLIVINN